MIVHIYRYVPVHHILQYRAVDLTVKCTGMFIGANPLCRSSCCRLIHLNMVVMKWGCSYGFLVSRLSSALGTLDQSRWVYCLAVFWTARAVTASSRVIKWALNTRTMKFIYLTNIFTGTYNIGSVYGQETPVKALKWVAIMRATVGNIQKSVQLKHSRWL